MDVNIFDNIVKNVESLKDSDLSEIVSDILVNFDTKINKYALHAYHLDANSSSKDLVVSSFKETLRPKITDALKVFLFKKEHWRNPDYKLEFYLQKVISTFSSQLHWDHYQTVKKSKPICPLCKIEGHKETLTYDGKQLRCDRCTSKLEDLKLELKKNPQSKSLQMRKNALQTFALHSRVGFRCFGCQRFIPKSSSIDNFIVCPYVDCGECGESSLFFTMSHPVKMVYNLNVSLDNSSNTDPDKKDFNLSKVIPDSNISSNPEVAFSFKKDYIKYKELISNTISSQKKLIKRTNPSGTLVQKSLMYDAFKEITEQSPEDMIRYLCHKKHLTSDPLQFRIFQRYVSLIEDYLPFTMIKAGRKIDIYSLTDPELSLFEGLSEFNSVVKDDGVIPNETKEEYIGGRKYKNYGPCFIGKLISVNDESTKKSYLNKVNYYTFSKIDTSLPPGTKVEVKHFRIPSHYEMKSMVFLQKIRKQLVESISFKLGNGNG